jgi:Flp pilus assembly protein protease CpaA
MFEITLLVLLLAWLLVCMLYDLRFRQLPMNLTLIPLVVAVIYALFHGGWVLVGLTISLIGFSDLEPRERRLLFAAVFSAFAAIFDPTKLVLVAALALIWLLWEVGAMGGADAKLLMVITLVIQHPIIFLFIAMAGGVQGFAALLLRKKEIPYIVAIFAGSTMYALNSLVLKIF